MIILLWILNFVISIFNAWGCGKSWVYTKQHGGFAHFMNWMGAIMSACGFTWCYLILLAYGAFCFGWLDGEHTVAAFELGYVVIIPAVLGSGLAITIQSWVRFIKRPGLLNGGITAYNTFAQIHNTMSAMETLPRALGHLGKIFSGDGKRSSSSDDGKGKAVILVVLLVIIAAISGILTTRWIIVSVSKGTTLPRPPVSA